MAHGELAVERQGCSLVGLGELGFDLGFYGRVLEDATLGYYSGKQPTLL